MYFADLLTFESLKIGTFGEEGRKVGETGEEPTLFRQPDKFQGLCRNKLGKAVDGRDRAFPEWMAKEQECGFRGWALRKVSKC